MRRSDEKELYQAIRRRLTKLQGNRSQRQFARDVGIHQQNLNSYLRDERHPGVMQLVKIARAHRLSLNWLVLGRGRQEI